METWKISFFKGKPEQLIKEAEVSVKAGKDDVQKSEGLKYEQVSRRHGQLAVSTVHREFVQNWLTPALPEWVKVSLLLFSGLIIVKSSDISIS